VVALPYAGSESSATVYVAEAPAPPPPIPWWLIALAAGGAAAGLVGYAAYTQLGKR